MSGLFTCLLLLSAVGDPYDPHPLTDVQKLQIESANDKSPLVEGASFYALLENAADWSDKQAGAVVPDYDAVRRNAESWRGRRCLVEGTLYRVLQPELMREGWSKVQGVVVRIDHSRPTPIAEDFVIVYLTDPPQWQWRSEKDGIPREHGSKIRVVARFYKLQPDKTERPVEGEERWKVYPTFVGKALAELETGLGSESSEGWSFTPVLMGGALFAAVFLLFYRFRMTGRSTGKIQEHIQRRRMMRDADGQADVDGEDDAQPVDLSDDPSQAMNELAERNKTPNPQD